MSVFGVFLVCIFTHSDWIQRDTEYLGLSGRIQSKCWEIRTRKTPNTNTFHAVYLVLKICKYVLWRFEKIEPFLFSGFFLSHLFLVWFVNIYYLGFSSLNEVLADFTTLFLILIICISYSLLLTAKLSTGTLHWDTGTVQPTFYIFSVETIPIWEYRIIQKSNKCLN